MPDLPIRAAARAARLATLPMTFAGRSVVGLGRRVGGRPAELVAAEVQARTAEQLFTVLGELKGGAMKVGQWMSAMEAAMPEPMGGHYSQALTRLQEAAPAMPATMVHDALARGLGRQWRTLFTVFDDQPTAAASIGQVHHAVWLNGQEVAVKLQYPRAAEALASDLKQLNRLTPLLRTAVPGMDARALFTELRARLMDEVDYFQEAEAQQAFADAYRDDPDFLVPDVVEVTDQVLVSEWVTGTPLAKIASQGTRQQRDRAGLLLTRFLLASPTRVGRLHGDPHPGNFRLTDDNRLAVLDYGATLLTPYGWPPRLPVLLRAARDRDAQALLHSATETGLVRGTDVAPEDLLALVDSFMEPLRDKTFHFTRAWLRSQTTRVSDPRSAASRTQRKLHLSVRNLLIQRVTIGTVGVLSLLDAQVPLRDEAAAWLPDLNEPC